MIWLSVYRDFFMRNLLRSHVEKIPLLGTTIFRGGLPYGYTYITASRFTNMSALLYSTSLLTFLIGMVSEQITTLMFARRSRE